MAPRARWPLVRPPLHDQRCCARATPGRRPDLRLARVACLCRMGSRGLVRAQLGSTGTPDTVAITSEWGAHTAPSLRVTFQRCGARLVQGGSAAPRPPARMNRAGKVGHDADGRKSGQKSLCGGGHRDLPSPGCAAFSWASGAGHGGWGAGWDEGERKPGDLVRRICVPARPARFPWGSSTRSLPRHWGLFWQELAAEGEAWGRPRAINQAQPCRPPRYVLAGMEQRPWISNVWK